MNQLYVQRFESKNPDKESFDKCWDIANKAFKETGNWGNVPSGIKTHYALATAWGGYGIIEVEDVDAFNAYQVFHHQNYSHAFDITFNPVGDMAVIMPDVYGNGSSQRSVQFWSVSMANKSSIVSDLHGLRTPSVSGEELQAPGKSGPQ